MIRIKSQNTDTSCTSACLAMIVNRDVDDVTEEFDELWHSNQTDPSTFLNDHAVYHHINSNPFHSSILMNYVYLVTVPSLNIPGMFHHVVIDFTKVPYTVFDPNNGRDNKNFYVAEKKTDNDREFQLISWLVDISIPRASLVHLYLD